jgi:hypothetical protein
MVSPTLGTPSHEDRGGPEVPDEVADVEDAPALHPALGPIGRLVGTWRGEGDGAYPTIEPFRYREEVVLAHDGRPVLAYRQRTWRIDADVPMHVESGYLRVPGTGPIELIIAQPTGIAEVASMEVREEDGMLVLDGARAALQRSGTAKEVVDVRRRFRLDGDTLHYDLWMTYAGHEDTHHLRAVLHRV